MAPDVAVVSENPGAAGSGSSAADYREEDLPPSTTSSSVADEPFVKRVISFPTPRKNEELQDFSCISFCSPFVAGNLTYEEEEAPEMAPLGGLKLTHLKRLGRLTTSTSTPLQSRISKTVRSRVAIYSGPGNLFSIVGSGFGRSGGREMRFLGR